MYIQELNGNVITVPSIMRQDIRDILVSFYSVLIYQHVSKSFETRQVQVENVSEKTSVTFTLSFLSRLDENVKEAKCKIYKKMIQGW